jgi:glycerophosphoryl diester phosphodiesterase
MAGFKAAVRVGAHALETDLHLSSDGVIVLTHVSLFLSFLFFFFLSFSFFLLVIPFRMTIPATKQQILLGRQPQEDIWRGEKGQ